MWKAITFIAGVVFYDRVTSKSDNWLVEKQCKYANEQIETKLQEIAVAKELLQAYGYDKPRG